MKYLLTVILAIYLVSSTLFPRTGSGQTGSENPVNLSGTFVLVKESHLRVSIDTGWERNGQAPVILTFGGLEVVLRIKTGELSYALSTETGISEMLSEDVALSFITYEQNPLRTRMMPANKNTPVKLKIDGEKGMAEVYVGENRLKLEPIYVRLTGITLGELYELTFIGPNIRCHKKLVFLPSQDMIYAFPHYATLEDLPLDPGKDAGWTVWAVRIEPGGENSLTYERKGVIK